jgi:hypothetical protein
VAATRPAEADKVGVAAAVNPDAFSSLAGVPKSQINIGKSIFYNERINTTGSGLVQVLLVDGSTFTVGPGSDLVINKFVYDPKKGTGQIAASFSKGVMRFVGGKLSKNNGGVTVDTPAGALAIRGGIAYADFKSPKTYSILFVFGEYLKLRGSTLFQPGYGWFSNNGQISTRPFNATDLAGILAALTNNNPAGFGNQNNDKPNPNNAGLLNTTSLNQLIADANATQVQAAILNAQVGNQASNQPTQPTQNTQNLSQGYAAGIYGQNGTNEFGTLTNFSPTEVALLFDGPGQTFSGAGFTLYADGAASGQGGAKIVFSPINVPTIPGGFPNSGLFAGGASSTVLNAISVYHDTIVTPGADPQLSGPAVLNSGEASLIGASGAGQLFCQSCTFLNWGVWFSNLDFENEPTVGSSQQSSQQVNIAGWWVAGDLPTIGQLPFQGTATYTGLTLGSVAAYIGNSGQWVTYVASGDVHMDWDFSQRAGVLEISNFDATGPYGALNASGTMAVPGQLANNAINKFSGPLLGTLGSGGYSSVSGSATGSFAANGTDTSASIIGNWTAGNNNYKATGIFGAGRDGPINPNGHLDLPPNQILTHGD